MGGEIHSRPAMQDEDACLLLPGMLSDREAMRNILLKLTVRGKKPDKEVHIHCNESWNGRNLGKGCIMNVCW